MERIGFHSRAAACLLDLVLLAIIVHLAAAIDVFINESRGAGYFGGVTWAGVALSILICAILESTSGASPGKRIMGLVIAADDGSRASRGALLRRGLIKFCPFALAVFPLIVFTVLDGGLRWRPNWYVVEGLQVLGVVDAIVTGLVTLYVLVGCFRVLGKDRQAFHDQLAGTAVFRAASLPTPAFTPVMAGEYSRSDEPEPQSVL